MSRFRGVWQSLNFDKEYLFGFETLSLCNFRDPIYAQSACNTPKRKENLKSHHMTPLMRKHIDVSISKQNATCQGSQIFDQ